MSSMKYLLTVAIVVTLASTVFAVRCYQCSSLQNPKCGEHFESEDNMKFDCNLGGAPRYMLSAVIGVNLNATGCMKQTVESTLGGGVHILRSCYFGDIKKTETGCKIDPTNFATKQMACDVCTGNLCNGSSSMAPLAFAIVVVCGLARIFS